MSLKTIHIMVGLPRSGKSTYAAKLSVEFNAPIVNPDSVRLALHGQAFIPTAEQMVWAIVDYMIKSLLMCHDHVILDATNTVVERREHFINMADTAIGYRMLCPHETIEARADEVGFPMIVIRNMRTKFNEPSQDEGFSHINRVEGYDVKDLPFDLLCKYHSSLPPKG